MPETRLDILGKRLGSWKVLLSPKALKSVQGLARSGNFRSIEEKLRDLASGSWSYHLAGSEEQRKKLRVSLAYTRCSPQIFLLWQIDVASDDMAQDESQVVKVWDIGTKIELSGAIDRVLLLQKSYSDDHVTQCRQKPLADADKSLLPRVFPRCPDASDSGERGPRLDIRTVDRQILEMANRFYTVTESMIRSVLANDLLAEFPFDFSGDETDIILHFQAANLILGRSGTGKTTCLVFKLLAKYVAGSAIPDQRAPRQLLLTRSAELASKLKDYIDRLIKTLLMNVTAERQEQEEEMPLLDGDDGDERSNNIFDLQNDSFPLVCTFDRLLDLLENTIKHIDEEGFPAANEDEDEAGKGDASAQENDSDHHSDTSDDENPRWQPRKKESTVHLVDLQSFKFEYWPKFPAALTKNVPAELAFAEIMGIIKGSLLSRETLKPLSRETYTELSSRMAPTFTLETEKSQMYDLFEKYQALKLRRREMDGVDRIVKLIEAMRDNQRLRDYLGATFDEIYIDEVQDLRCLDIELVLDMLQDGRAFHFAGDTAQAISQETHFRFQDIKALFYHHFANAATSTQQPELSRPRLFTLAKNYRSHQGILSLASLVMEMLWNGFPETVDRLEPEIGQLHGPTPVFFLNCDVQMLISSGTSTNDQAQQGSDFGAEQVIIVRDHNTKVKLQAEFKDRALVLTVLQSKGMEFEDVMLWNFFTDSPCPGGWRCVGGLKNASGKFDSKKHAAMCSELKQFYVAVTRARIRFSIIESEDILAARVADVLRQDVSSPLVEVTRSTDPDFLKEMGSLRSISHDPEKWSQRGQELMQRKQYDDAAICFRRAKDKRGETCAMAWVCEETGRRSASVGDSKVARDCFRSAVQKFKEIEMVADAVRNLERMEEHEEAAWLWAQYGKPGKAAPLFSKASVFTEASNHYHQAHSYDDAADALRQGNLAENWVSYVTDNQKKLNPKSFHCRSSFSAFLLKQKKLRSHFLTAAIRLVGSPDKQEQAFIAYEIHDQLADLYAREGKFKERLLLLSRIGMLGSALNTVPSLNTSDTKNVEEIVQRVQIYYAAGRIICPRQHETHVPVRLQSSNSDWISAQRLITGKQRDTIIQKIEAMRSGIAKDLLRLHALFNVGLLDTVLTLEKIPFNTIEGASKIAEDLASLLERTPNQVVMLLAGVMEVDRKVKPFILLPWSPLSEAAINFNASEYPRLGNEWFLQKFGNMILRLDAILRNLWKSEWSARCVHFLTQGHCNNRSCLFKHEKVKESDSSKKLSLLVKIATIFSRLSAVYRKKRMNEDFQKRFLGIRRHWLESLLRELTFVSSFEQCSRAIVEARSKILSARRSSGQDKRLKVLAASLEDLLYHRLGKDLNERHDISSLLERLHFSQILDHNVQERFAWYLSQKLSRLVSTRLQQRQLSSLRHLEGQLGNSSASTFGQILRQFTYQISLADISQLSSLHSVTTTFEFFTTYLILQSCRVAVIIPQSWIEIHLPGFAPTEHSLLAREASSDDLRIYADSLLVSTAAFCQLLLRLETVMDSTFTLDLNRYPSRLLHQRNMELLALVIVNLAFSGIEIKGFKDVWRSVSRIFSFPYNRGFHLQHTSMQELLEKLVKSYTAYNGKDCIKFARKTDGQHRAESKLQKLGVPITSLAKLISAATACGGRPTSAPSNESDAQFARRTKAAEKIWRFWRSHHAKLLAKRAFMGSPAGRLYTEVLEICKQNATTRTMRYILTGYGVRTLESLQRMSTAAHELQQQAVEPLESVPQEKFEQIDQTIQHVHDIEESLANVGQEVSMARFEELARWEPSETRQLFLNADSAVEKAASDLQEARKMMKKVQGAR